MDDTKMLEVESKWFERGVKEAIHIRVTHSHLNKDGGRYNLPRVWTNILNERTQGPGLGSLIATNPSRMTLKPSSAVL